MYVLSSTVYLSVHTRRDACSPVPNGIGPRLHRELHGKAMQILSIIRVLGELGDRSRTWRTDRGAVLRIAARRHQHTTVLIIPLASSIPPGAWGVFAFFDFTRLQRAGGRAAATGAPSLKANGGGSRHA